MTVYCVLTFFEETVTPVTLFRFFEAGFDAVIFDAKPSKGIGQ